MKKTFRELQFKVLIERDEDGLYVASVPELPACYTQGETLEKARQRIKEVIKLILAENKDLRKERLETTISYPRFLAVEDLVMRVYA